MASSRISLRVQQRTFTRERLLGAAKEVFAERGYVDATVEDIAARAGASRATFYLHFRSKTELTLALIEEAERLGVERYRVLDELLSGPPDQARAELRAWLAGWLGPWREDAGSNAAVWQAASSEPDIERRLIALSQAFISALERTFDQWPAERRAEVRERALMVEMMTQRLFYLAAHSEFPSTDDTLLDFLTDLWWSHFVSPQRAAVAAGR